MNISQNTTSMKAAIVALATIATLVSSAGLANATTFGEDVVGQPVPPVAKETHVDANALKIIHENLGTELGLTIPGQQAGSISVEAAEVPADLFLGEGDPIANSTMSGSVISTYKTALGSQSIIKITDSEAPQDFRFPLDLPEGASAAVTEVGAVAITDAEGVLLGGVNAPWAVDATGAPVETTLAVEGSTLIQKVDTSSAKFPIVADPSIQWIPHPVVALYGSQARAIGNMFASTAVVVIGGTCTLAVVGGYIGRAFTMVCSLVGLGAAKDIFRTLGNIWANNPSINMSSCYGFYLYNLSAYPANLPARDCSW